MVLIGALGLFFSGPGQTYSVSIFIDYYVTEVGWSHSLVSGLYSIATLISGLNIAFMGKIIDRKGHRKIFTVVPILLGLTCIWMSFVRFPIMLGIGFIFLRFFGQGSLTLIPDTLVPQWFQKKRGIALSIMTLGGSIGAMAIPPVNNFLISSYGVELAWRFWALLLIFFMAPVALLLVRNKPEDIGEKPDGQGYNYNNHNKRGSHDKAIKSSNLKKQNLKEEESMTLKEARKTKAFWVLLFISAIPALVNTAITFHMVSIMQLKGHTTGFAAYILSIFAISQLISTFFAGFVYDRISPNYVKGMNFFIFLITILILIYFDSYNILIIYSILHGLFNAFNLVGIGVLWPYYFGREHLGSIRGMATTAVVLGSALGPLPFGMAYDLFGSYNEILLLTMLFPLIAGVFCIVLPSPSKS
ncbi:MFS transporter [Natranaerofaba carboxydovora]|uniref:MFS transporter n=1 Tax=Natranaerofaba carboxydovora TaxID=2742683 RepID=UPI001F145E11|nr:MFS transporter [Natranaerofaba carboxydovora]